MGLISRLVNLCGFSGGELTVPDWCKSNTLGRIPRVPGFDPGSGMLLFSKLGTKSPLACVIENLYIH